MIDPQPKRRALRIVSQFSGRQAEGFPGAKLSRAGCAVCRMALERGPFGRRAVFEDSISVFTRYIHRIHRAPAAELPRGGSSIWRRFFFAWKSVFFEAASLISSIEEMSAWRKPSTS